MMSDNGTPLRVIQEVSGHRNLEQLQAYIEVREEQVLGAVTGLTLLSPVSDTGKYIEVQTCQGLNSGKSKASQLLEVALAPFPTLITANYTWS